MAFPMQRLRRLRSHPTLREMVRETELNSGDLILPLFVRSGKKLRKPILSMPGQFQLSVDESIREAKKAWGLGILSVILFGIPDKKDELGSEAYSKEGVVQKTIRLIKKELPGMVVIADCCLCEYTSHGHCGMIQKNTTGSSFRRKPESSSMGPSSWIPAFAGMTIDNDATLEVLGKVALSQAEAGADLIAPSGMMDGMVYSIRTVLDKNNFSDRGILSYSAKYASSFYGPFREAAEGKPQFGDRKSYQMDAANGREALREVELDIREGADIVMVKPALAYLDVVRSVKEKFGVPVAAYNVSGEYSMVKAAAKNGWLEEKSTVLEILNSMKRAGADLILSYHSMDAARWLKG